jgi:hypothetical protein
MPPKYYRERPMTLELPGLFIDLHVRDHQHQLRVDILATSTHRRLALSYRCINRVRVLSDPFDLIQSRQYSAVQLRQTLHCATLVGSLSAKDPLQVSSAYGNNMQVDYLYLCEGCSRLKTCENSDKTSGVLGLALIDWTPGYVYRWFPRDRTSYPL